MAKKIRKSIEVEIDETVYADVSLGLDEIIEFIDSCTQDEKADILNRINSNPTIEGIKIKTLEDVMKMEILINLFNKYSLLELDQIKIQ